VTVPPLTLTPTSTTRVVAVGDSVLLGAAPVLQQAVPTIAIDAAVGRQTPAVTATLQTLAAAGNVPDIVVIHTGNNGPIAEGQFDTLLQAVAGARHVLVLTVKVPMPWEGPNDRLLVSAVRRFPNAEVVDWRQAAQGHPEYLLNDGVHLTPAGMRAYSTLIASRLAADGVRTAPGWAVATSVP
jgi:hypothetical protein